LGRAVFLLSLAAFASAASLRATDPLLPQIAATTASPPARRRRRSPPSRFPTACCRSSADRSATASAAIRTIAAAALVSAFGSAACALAPTLDSLVIARFVSGATIGAFIPLSLAWIGDTVAYEKRQPLLARFPGRQMAGVAFGNAAAGLLGEHFGWRAIFMALAAVAAPDRSSLVLEIRDQRADARGSRQARRDARKLPPHAAHAGNRCRLQKLFGTAYAEGLFIFGALAFVAAYFQAVLDRPWTRRHAGRRLRARRGLLCATSAARGAAAG
jgi:MFS family permease